MIPVFATILSMMVKFFMYPRNFSICSVMHVVLFNSRYWSLTEIQLEDSGIGEPVATDENSNQRKGHVQASVAEIEIIPMKDVNNTENMIQQTSVGDPLIQKDLTKSDDLV
eukprot:TRINITY_DN5360_c0_g1_i1.p2 TRINITY_DN5360_c0_g1~~TRINITY_DN5360_c0_g1_i1.p2  ORF type:complete len:111 (-),score=12.10 TRINITY_DN5360_c0_g1_i1:468-800(-)